MELTLPLILIALLLFIVGAAVGSFISVLSYRLHHDHKGIVKGRSKCTTCEKPLKALDLIPILSYLTLRGRCRYCAEPISFMYPLLELITGAAFVLLFLHFPFVVPDLFFSMDLLGLYLLHAFYLIILIFTFFYDLQYLHVADSVILPGILVGLIATMAPQTPHIFDSLLGAAVAIIFFGLQILLSRGRWLGEGDLRIGIFMGVILGWKLVIVALFLSYIIGSIASLVIVARTKKVRGVKIALGPFLVIGTLISLFWGERILGWYLGVLI